jgi:hypothetical protein
MQVTIRLSGFVKVLTAIQAIGSAGKAVEGQLAAFGSSRPYARPIETNEFLSGPRKGQIARRAGPARMFEQGRNDARKLARQILPAAIVKGPASVGQAKRKIRDYGIERIRLYTPVRSGKLRDSVRDLNRPGGV